MPGLNVVALISGGKDSLFSILHCRANGHNVNALANLHPRTHDRNEPIDDLESYMYQTVGHAVIPLYEQALGLPVYRQEITGTAINKDKSYSPASAGATEDETESLFALLKKVKRGNPEVNAVSTGAILSDYQRTRVESVALRLGLEPLSYLWQWPSLPPHTQESLLEDMAAVGQDARIIKVASGGLDESFLWQNVADRRTITRLAKAAQRFGAPGDGAVLGEGGEYETLAVAGPSPLWKGRIKVTSENIQNIPGDAGSASVRLTGPSFEPHESNVPTTSALRMPPLFDSQFAEVRATILSGEDDKFQGSAGELPISLSPNEQPGKDAIILNDVYGFGNTVSEQTRSAMDDIASRLGTSGHSMYDVAYSIIVLRKMSDFAAFNEIYGSYFVKPNPPARLTIACADALPARALVSISITSALGPREGLHVQSKSYWAPANIGPYSQAIKFPESNLSAAVQASVFIAGQIPLIPASMELPDDMSPSPLEIFAEQAALSLQHLDRIGCVMGVRQWMFGIAFITTCASHDESNTRRAKMAKSAWRAWHLPTTNKNAALDDADDFDVWDQKHGPASVPWQRQSGHDEPGTAASSDTSVPPIVVIEVDSLPRGATVEWMGFGKTSTGGCSSSIPPHLHGLLQRFRHRTVLSG